MYISPIQNNDSQSFGKLTLRNNGAKRLAQYFVMKDSAPSIKNDFFENVAKPINKLESEVVYDGIDVFVENPVLNRLAKISDCYSLKGGAWCGIRAKEYCDEFGWGDEKWYHVDLSDDYKKTLGMIAGDTNNIIFRLKAALQLAFAWDKEAVLKDYESKKNFNTKERINTINQITDELNEKFGQK